MRTGLSTEMIIIYSVQEERKKEQVKECYLRTFRFALDSVTCSEQDESERLQK